jgi:hypothetical protein
VNPSTSHSFKKDGGKERMMSMFNYSENGLVKRLNLMPTMLVTTSTGSSITPTEASLLYLGWCASVKLITSMDR